MQTGVLFALSLSLLACGEDPDAEVRLRVTPDTTVRVGETITVDATDSIYDAITWYLEGAIYGPCQTRVVCDLSFTQSDNYTLRVVADKSYTPDPSGFSRSGESRDEKVLELVILP